jgi:hypothetical protein
MVSSAEKASKHADGDDGRPGELMLRADTVSVLCVVLGVLCANAVDTHCLQLAFALWHRDVDCVRHIVETYPATRTVLTTSLAMLRESGYLVRLR